MSRSRRLLLVAAPFLLALAALAVAPDQADVAEALLYTAPGALLALPLAFGRYPGAARIHRLLGRPGVRRSSGGRGAVRRSALVAPRGGALLARSRAVRGPPSGLPQHG